MIRINIIEDEALIEPLNRLISAMLPHEQHNPELALDVLGNIERYIKIEEMNMEYYVLCSSIREILKIKSSKKGFKTVLLRDVFESVLLNNVSDLIRNENVGMIKWLDSTGLPYDIEVETTFEMACQKLYDRCMELYDICYSIQQDTETALNYIPSLKSAYIKNIAEVLIKMQVKILNSSIREGYKRLAGPDAWLKYTLEKVNAIKGRLDETENDVYTLDSIAKSKELVNNLQEMLRPICEWGIPPIDDNLPVCRHRLIVLCANEGVGKTTMSIDVVVNALRNNKKVLFMTGESSKEVIWAKVLSNYIYKEYGVYITENHISQKDSIDLPEDKLKLLNIAESSLVAKKAFSTIPHFTYSNIYTELVSCYEKNPFDLLVIDHTLALKGQGDEYSKVSELGVGLRDFKKDYPVGCLVLSHLSTAAKQSIDSGKSVRQSPTRGSGILSNEADEIFVLFKNDILEKQGLIGMQQYKRRNSPPLEDYAILKTKFSVQAYEWDEKFQSNYGEETISTETAIQNLNEIYEDDDYEDLDDYEDYEDYDDLDDYMDDN